MNLRAALLNAKENGNEYNGSYRVWGLGVEKGMETRLYRVLGSGFRVQEWKRRWKLAGYTRFRV